jgi:hypothetical protein
MLEHMVPIVITVTLQYTIRFPAGFSLKITEEGNLVMFLLGKEILDLGVSLH